MNILFFSFFYLSFPHTSKCSAQLHTSCASSRKSVNSYHKETLRIWNEKVALNVSTTNQLIKGSAMLLVRFKGRILVRHAFLHLSLTPSPKLPTSKRNLSVYQRYHVDHYQAVLPVRIDNLSKGKYRTFLTLYLTRYSGDVEALKEKGHLQIRLGAFSPEKGTGKKGNSQKKDSPTDSWKPIYFLYKESTLTQRSMQLLGEYAKWLKKHPSIRLRLAGHTDKRGEKNNNKILGERRAKKAACYLVRKGIQLSRLSITSYGDSQPASLQQTEAGFKKNRRVTFQQIHQLKQRSKLKCP